jgi:site-specific DNA-methyltransferase (adenine-specific)
VNSLFLGNCLEILPKIPEGSVNLILSDLPYGITRNSWDLVIPLDILWAEFKRVLKPTGIVALTASQPFSSKLVLSNEKWFRHEWIWIKNRGSNFGNTSREPMKEHESVLIFSPGQWTFNRQFQERTGGGLSRVKYEFKAETKTLNYGRFGAPRETQGDLRVPSSWQKFNCEVGLHPTQKPLSLMEYIIKTYSNEGDVVLDPCMGSGTTCLAAKNLERQYIGIELNPIFFGTAEKRVG